MIEYPNKNGMAKNPSYGGHFVFFYFVIFVLYYNLRKVYCTYPLPETSWFE